MILPPEDDYLRIPQPPRKGRQFSRGGGVGGGSGVAAGGSVGPSGPRVPGPRRFRGQYVRTRSPQTGKYDGLNNQQPQNNANRQQSASRSQPQPQQQRTVDDIKDICLKMSAKMDLVEARINEMAGNLERMQSHTNDQPMPGRAPQTLSVNGKKPKVPRALKKRHVAQQETNEVNGEHPRRTRQRRDGPKKTFPELTDAELNEIVQTLKRDFFASELASVRKAVEEKGPVVVKEFAMAILDHAICDVTSPTKLSDIANNLAQILTSEDVGFKFQHGFFLALTDISKREEDIAIDAPRYMDTLGQVLGECLVPMNAGRTKQLIKKFLSKSLQSYAQQSRALLLASTMRGIAGRKDERFAKEIWDLSNLDWATYLKEDANMDEFLESQEVKFTTQSFSPEPRKTRRTPEEKEKFADDVTDLVEKRCSTQALEDLVRDLNLEDDETVDYLGTLIYAVVRGCLVTDSGDYKLDTEVLNKYSSILKNQQQSNGKEQADAIALNALTALTKLWHEYNCPQNLMSNILLALHNHGAASYDALKNWLNSEDLKNIPGIGAARLNSKRCIEELAKRS